MTTEIWVNIGSGNGLLPDGTKPLPEPNVDLSSIRSSGIHLRAILQEIPHPSVTEIGLTITSLKFCSNLPGTNELNQVTATHWKISSMGAQSSNELQTCLQDKVSNVGLITVHGQHDRYQDSIPNNGHWGTFPIPWLTHSSYVVWLWPTDMK